MDGCLSFSDGEVRLDSQLLPGLFESLSIGSEVVFDEAEEDGKSGTTKTPMGWNDADLTLNLALLTDQSSSCYDKLAALNGVFKGYDNGGNPKVLTVNNPHMAARGIDQVVFKRLSSKEDNQTDKIVATLAFCEHNPPIQKVEERAEGGGASGTVASASAPGATQPEPSLSIDVG